MKSTMFFCGAAALALLVGTISNATTSTAVKVNNRSAQDLTVVLEAASADLATNWKQTVHVAAGKEWNSRVTFPTEMSTFYAYPPTPYGCGRQFTATPAEVKFRIEADLSCMVNTDAADSVTRALDMANSLNEPVSVTVMQCINATCTLMYHNPSLTNLNPVIATIVPAKVAKSNWKVNVRGVTSGATATCSFSLPNELNYGLSIRQVYSTPAIYCDFE